MWKHNTGVAGESLPLFVRVLHCVMLQWFITEATFLSPPRLFPLYFTFCFLSRVWSMSKRSEDPEDLNDRCVCLKIPPKT